MKMAESAENTKVIYYASTNALTGRKLLRVMEMLFPQEHIEVFDSIPVLKQRLHQPLTDPLIFVLLTSTREELLELTGLSDALAGRKVIMVLPDNDSESIARGHSLRPRFVSFADSDFLDLLVVLGKMSNYRTSKAAVPI